MKSLLNDQYVPLTHQVGFLEGDFRQIADAYLAWRQALQPQLKHRLTTTDLRQGLKHLDPLTTPWDREILIATASNWIAYFNNGLRSSDPESPIGHLCTVVPCRGVVAHSVPDRADVTHPSALRIYGAVSFTQFAPTKREWLNVARHVCAMNDGGRWAFFDEGERFPFEQPEKYRARRIRDRLTPEMLEEYCKALGIRLFDENFYGGQALAVIIPNQRTPGSPIMPLEQAHKFTLIR